MEVDDKDEENLDGTVTEFIDEYEVAALRRWNAARWLLGWLEFSDDGKSAAESEEDDEDGDDEDDEDDDAMDDNHTNATSI